MIRKLRFLLLLLVFIPFIDIEKKTYETSTIKYEASSIKGNNYLKEVKFEGVDFTFDKNKTSYEIDVPYSKTTLGLSYVAMDEDAIVEVVGDDELLVGNNSLAILVTAVDGSVREYDFTINRSDDNSEIANDETAIVDGLKSDDSSQITVNVRDNDAVGLSSSTVNTLKSSEKALIYKWIDQNGNMIASLKIDGKKIDSTGKIDPNIKGSISNASLLKQIEGYTYTALSTYNTNIPKGSIYTMTVTGGEDLYYLYYYDGDILITKPLRNIDGKVEFEIEGGYDYAILGSSDRPQKTISGFSWFWPSILITLLFVVFIVVTRTVMIKSVRDSHTPHLEEEKKEDNSKNKRK